MGDDMAADIMAQYEQAIHDDQARTYRAALERLIEEALKNVGYEFMESDELSAHFRDYCEAVAKGTLERMLRIANGQIWDAISKPLMPAWAAEEAKRHFMATQLTALITQPPVIPASVLEQLEAKSGDTP